MYQDNLDFCPPDYYTLEDNTIQFYNQTYDCPRLKTSDQWIWTTKEGKEIPVREMDTNHIKNCIKMIYKKNGAVNCFTAFIGELIKRGEI